MSVGTAVPSPDGAPEPEDAVAGVVRLLRELRVRRLPRHRVQRDPRGGRGHRRQPAVQVPDQGPRRDPPRRPRHHPRRDQAQGRAGLLHAVVRRARQGHRRRHRPSRRRGRAALDRGRSPGPLADDERRAAWTSRSRTSPRRLAALALQGPFSRAVLEAATGEDFADLRYFRRRASEDRRASTIDVSRTGYTGDLGYELWIPAERAEAVWDALFEAGAAYAIRPAGMLALDVTRLEAGLILLEVDYTSARHAMNPEQNYSPFEIGLGRLVSFDKADYVGRRALKAEQAAGGPPRRLVGPACSTGTTSSACTTSRACRRRSRRPPTARTCPCSREAGRQVGKATSHGWSPILKQAIALASVAAALRAGRHPAPGRVDGRGPPRPGQRDGRRAAVPRPRAQARVTAAPAQSDAIGRLRAPSTAWSRSASSAGPRSWSSSSRSRPRAATTPGSAPAADWTADRLRRLGATVEVARASTALPPLVVGEIGDGPRTVTAVQHYDVQPAAPLELWTTPPYEPADPRRPGLGPRRDGQQGRVPAARSGRVEAWLEAVGPLPCRVRYLVEGEEETGQRRPRRAARPATASCARPTPRSSRAASLDLAGRPWVAGRRQGDRRRSSSPARRCAYDAHSSLPSLLPNAGQRMVAALATLWDADGPAGRRWPRHRRRPPDRRPARGRRGAATCATLDDIARALGHRAVHRRASTASPRSRR